MQCEACGKLCSDGNKFCTGCGAPLPEAAAAEAQREEKISSHMTLAVITTILFGNWILGIPAIVFARECELAAESGQTELARRFSRRALTFLAVGSALSLAVICFVVMIVTMSGGILGY